MDYEGNYYGGTFDRTPAPVPMNYGENFSALTLEDFDSENILIRRVPRTASQTCRGQILIKPIVRPIPYTGLNKRLGRKTVEEFRLNKHEQNVSQGTTLHKFDHI